jgi:CheY-like chemotaxis protein
MSPVFLFLQHLGYEVTAACNGQEGISLFDKKPKFDLVITDIKMPGLSGNEVAKHIRDSDRPHTPIVAITGFGEDIGQELFDGILLKPFKIKSLLKIIETLNKLTKTTAQNKTS